MIHGHESQPGLEQRRALSENEQKIERLGDDVILLKRGMVVLVASLVSISLFCIVSVVMTFMRLR